MQTVQTKKGTEIKILKKGEQRDYFLAPYLNQKELSDLELQNLAGGNIFDDIGTAFKAWWEKQGTYVPGPYKFKL